MVLNLELQTEGLDILKSKVEKVDRLVTELKEALTDLQNVGLSVNVAPSGNAQSDPPADRP